MELKSIYRKAFIFEANYFEEYQNGSCTKKGQCNTEIIAKVMSPDCIGMVLQKDTPANINTYFGLPIFGAERGDVLADRVQYGRIPDSFSWKDPNEPLVCEIFNNLMTIRFAMLSPLRMVEFHGKFTDVRTL